MGKLETYRQYIQKLLTQRASFEQSEAGIETHLILDTERDYYQLLDIGWQQEKQVFDCYLYLQIKNGKIWIYRDLTDRAIADELRELGVPNEDIVLAFYTPQRRQFTNFAVC